MMIYKNKYHNKAAHDNVRCFVDNLDTAFLKENLITLISKKASNRLLQFISVHSLIQALY